MSMPIRSLPTTQNWDCRGCTDCCHEYRVPVTDEERERITAQGWPDDADFQDTTLFVREGRFGGKRWRLNQRPDGGCVFLAADGGCRIHAAHGAAAKPLACRIYPFVLTPAGDHWRVGLRYACPSAAEDRGRPLDDHADALKEYSRLLEEREGISPEVLPPPPMPRGQPVDWRDFSRLVRAFTNLIRDDGVPLERRLRKCLALARTCADAKFDKVAGNRLTEFLALVSSALDDDVPAAEQFDERPRWVGRMIFRQVIAVYSRKDAGTRRRQIRAGRLGLMWAAWRFARGAGRVPRLNADLAAVDFADVESPTGPIPESIEARLATYYQVKLESLQFCGKPNFGMTLWDGIASLMLTFPAICWLARAMPDRPREEAFILALRTVDDNFGFNPLLGGYRQRFGLRQLAERKDLDRLIWWYAR